MAAVEKWKKSIITRVTSWHRWTKSLFNPILWFKFLFPRFPCPGSFQKMHNISKRHIKLTKAYQIEPAIPRKAKLNFELIDDWVEKLKKAGQLNPLWLVGLVVPLAIFYFLRVCLLSIPAVENYSTKVGNTPNSIFLYNFIRHFWIETWPTEAQRRQMPVKTFDNTIIKTNYGIDQYHRGWRFKNCADYLFCSFDFFYFWSGERRRRNWFSDLYVNKW